MALADQFAVEAKDSFRWTPGMDWMSNSGTHWERDILLKRYTLATEICKGAATAVNERAAMRVCSAATANALLTLARDKEDIATPVHHWDAFPTVLNTPAGPINLETGKPQNPEGLLFTQKTAIGPQTMPTPAWDKFLADVFAGDLEMVEFIQRMAGYCITGSVKEQKLFFLHGTGANGKSVFLDALRAIMGTYAHNLPSEALMASRHEGHPTMLASLHGKRLAISSEIEESAYWAESRIKSLTGDETITARFMHKDFFTFRVTHKHLIAGNFKPRLKGDDYAMARRLVLVPFAQRFEGVRRDNNLPDKLRGEYPGILAWAIQGAVKWTQGGLAIPEAVTAASKDYMAEQNDLELWIDECCDRVPTASASAAAAYTSFAKWKEASGEHAPSKKSFSQRLERLFNKRHTRTGNVFDGLLVNTSDGEGNAYERASRGF